MIKKIFAIVILGILFNSCGSSKKLIAADNVPIEVVLNLRTVTGDKIKVEVNPAAFDADMVSFMIPKTIPGTYSTDNYGKYVVDFKALDAKGRELKFSKSDDNTWNILNAKKLDKVTYYVNDTFDTESEVSGAVFSPAGTNILKDENFILNLHGFVGYFKGLKEVPYIMTINKPAHLMSTTSLLRKEVKNNDENVDVFKAGRYFDLVDNPIMYGRTKTESFEINGITVNLSVYSPNNAYTAASLKGLMEKMMGAQKAFLGKVNGTKEYTILVYLSTMEPDDASGFGALEHHKSTVVVLPEAMPKERLEQAMVDVVSHEFFHTLTPLNVHSKEIQYFDYNDPKMSEHLWMYEGTTEYFANLFQIQQGLIDETEFYKRIMDKIMNAKSYDDTMSFTLMSKNILSEPYEQNYANVYEKGALINMALDISLRELSGGKKGVLWMMKELSEKYGNNTPFEDATLINEIVAMTYPEIRTFFDSHVIGTIPIDYNIYLAKVGLSTAGSKKQSGYFLDGNVPFIDVDQTNENAIFFRKGITLNSSLVDLGIKGGDIIKSINGSPINLNAIRLIIRESNGWAADSDITMVVKRGEEEITLKGKVGEPMLAIETISSIDNPTEAQLKLRAAWLKG